MSTITEQIGEAVECCWTPSCAACAHQDPTQLPDVFWTGGESGAAVAFGYGEFRWAGVLIFNAGIFDMTDGAWPA